LLSTGFAKRLAAFAGQHVTRGQDNSDLCSNSVIFYGGETPKLFEMNRELGRLQQEMKTNKEWQGQASYYGELQS